MASRRVPAVLVGLAIAVLAGHASAEEPVGQRPYELDWAGRGKDTRPPLVDFEKLKDWNVECHHSEATWSRSRRQQIWGRYVGKLVHRGVGSSPMVTVRPPRLIPVDGDFDSVNLWVYGNNWAWSPDPTTPPVRIEVLLAAPGGREVPVAMGTVRWKEWWLMHARLGTEQLDSLGKNAAFAGIRIHGGRNEEDRELFFDNLAVYRESLAPLQFEPRPKRGIEPFPGQTTGTNNGPDRLPFPTRTETILPDNLTDEFQVRLERSGDAYLFRYQGNDGQLVYRYRPKTGSLGDIEAEWIGRGPSFRPMVGGGVCLVAPDRPDPVPPDAAELIDCRQEGETVVSRWKCSWKKQTTTVTYSFRLWQKSLVVDVVCPGGVVGEFRIGAAVGLDNPRLVTVPYLAGDRKRPAVLVSGDTQKPLFLTALVDHCRSNASSLWMANEVTADGVLYNGGSRYLPKTDGRRNDCFERLFLTVSPRFEEVLPNVPNPKSSWMHVTSQRVWRAHGASDRQRDFDHWQQIARYGMSKVLITDHETGWRDGGESFTFRTRAAPEKGGDQGQAEYARKIRALGFRYGIYNNYTDFAPVNGHWDEDLVTRLSDGNWRTAWARCYNPKPSRAVEMEAKLAPVIQEKFQLDTAYCDVHTAVQPWRYCDFDARVPGAGTFAATFYAYGEIMLHQKKTWGGPVYSEGNNHWYYCGLTDGNYGQDQAAHLDVEPWLVDFDLRKLHPLCCNFGMGNPGMFYGRKRQLGSTPEQRSARLDRFLAATLAFGHTGFLVTQGGLSNTLRSYYALQQLHARYAQATAAEIRYADPQGQLLETSAAVATGAFRRSQIATTYSNGLRVLVNGHPTETWQTDDARLPPNGWFAADGEGALLAYSALVDGRRVDYVDSPAYLYADGRGRFTRFAKAACDAQLVALKQPDGSLEVIPYGPAASFGVSLGGQTGTAIALDPQRRELGPAECRLARGLVYVTAVPQAVSYVLKPAGAPPLVAVCDRDEAVPGETVVVRTKASHTYRIPSDTTPGTRLWKQFNGAWIDFTVVPMLDAKLIADKEYELTLRSRLPAPANVEVALTGQTQQVRLTPGQPTSLRYALDRPSGEQVRTMPLKAVAGNLSHEQTWWLKAEHAILALTEVPESFETGQCLREGKERSLDTASGAQAYRRETTCGEKTRASLFMHPPYKTGVGYTWALSSPIDLPREPEAALRCAIGKADGSDPGDGILFRIRVVQPDGEETTVAEKQWGKHAWTPFEANLGPWAGSRVRLKLIADVGGADNSSGDWSAWSDLRIESADPVLATTLHDQPVQLRYEPGPYPIDGLRIQDLRKATKATLHFEGIGLQKGGQYVSHAQLNGIALGALPSAGGNEEKGTWAEATVPLTAAAIAALGQANRFCIRNPGNDCFKIRRVWIELELADRRRLSSLVTTPVQTQPPNWRHAEGTGIPFGTPIELEVRFKTE